MRRSLRSRAPNNKVETASFELKGGLNLVDPPLEIPAGMLLAATNYELLPRGGYRRIDGFERSDGQPRPSDANYWILDFDAGGLGPELITNGDFTGNADGWSLGTGWAYGTNNLVATSATGNVTQSNVPVVDDATYQLTYTLSGYVDGSYRFFIWGDSGTKRAVTTARTANGTYVEDFTLSSVSAGTAGLLSLQTLVDGSVTIDDISIRQYLPAPAVGSLVTGQTSGATGKVGAVVLNSGSWATGDADGYIALYTLSGTFQNDETLSFTAADPAFDVGFSSGFS